MASTLPPLNSTHRFSVLSTETVQIDLNGEVISVHIFKPEYRVPDDVTPGYGGWWSALPSVIEARTFLGRLGMRCYAALRSGNSYVLCSNVSQPFYLQPEHWIAGSPETYAYNWPTGATPIAFIHPASLELYDTEPWSKMAPLVIEAPWSDAELKIRRKTRRILKDGLFMEDVLYQLSNKRYTPNKQFAIYEHLFKRYRSNRKGNIIRIAHDFIRLVGAESGEAVQKVLEAQGEPLAGRVLRAASILNS